MMLLALVVMVTMVVANWMMFRGAIAVVLIAPIGWLVVSAYRYNALSNGLRSYLQRRDK